MPGDPGHLRPMRLLPFAAAGDSAPLPDYQAMKASGR
jgi:hypothetical protein